MAIPSTNAGRSAGLRRTRWYVRLPGLADLLAWGSGGGDAQASPIALAPLGVPSVCVHGTADTLLPISQSKCFCVAARAAGDPADLRTFDGDHFDPITVGTTAWGICVDGLRRLTGG